MAAFALEKAARNLTRSVGALLIIAGEWEKILAFCLRLFAPTQVTNTTVSPMLTMTAPSA